MAKFSFVKGKGIFIVDVILIPTFILVIYSGLKLHIAGHTNDHDIWSYWAHYHILVSSISIIFGWFHVKAHWGWYKNLINKGINKKSKITFALSFLFLILIITGIVLICFIDGGNSRVGLWHYRLGLIIILFLIIHLFVRFPILKKGLRRKK